jgi:crossover junction endodeoxyribonuclease RusA
LDYEFELPFPPSVNAWKTPFRNRMILTKRGRGYRKEVDAELRRLGLRGELVDGNLSVSITLNPPSLRRYDVDNFTKSLFDALTTSGFWIDDSQVQRMTVHKGVKVAGGNVQIKVELIGS